MRQTPREALRFSQAPDAPSQPREKVTSHDIQIISVTNVFVYKRDRDIRIFNKGSPKDSFLNLKRQGTAGTISGNKNF